MLKICLLVILIVCPVFSAFAWDDAGHKISAYIAWQRMTPDVREKVIKILLEAPEDSQLATFYMQYGSRSTDAKQREFLGIVSTWADIIRDRNFETRYKKYHHSNWHYSDTFWTVKDDKIEFLKAPEEGGKAVEKLFEYDKLARSSSASDAQKAIALGWLTHLIGDLHQPLHTSARVTESEPKGDQGGNLFLLTPKDTPRDKQENLHWFWDSIIGRNIVRKNEACDADYLDPIARAIVKKHTFAKMQGRLNLGKYDEWQQESLKLATTDVFSADLNRHDMPTPAYKKKAFRIAQEQIALAGYRMGETFNQIFGKAATP